MNKYDSVCVQGEGFIHFFCCFSAGFFRIFAGAYGIVLKCRNKESGELVAIKKFKGDGGFLLVVPSCVFISSRYRVASL
jgi:hypothetical protein